MKSYKVNFFSSFLIIDRGFPVWLHNIPGIEFRTNNEIYKVLILILILFNIHLGYNIKLISMRTHISLNNYWITLSNIICFWVLCFLYFVLHFFQLLLTFLNYFIYLQNEMQIFTTKIVNLCKEAKLFASQGGPIILAQVSPISPL